MTEMSFHARTLRELMDAIDTMRSRAERSLAEAGISNRYDDRTEAARCMRAHDRQTKAAHRILCRLIIVAGRIGFEDGFTHGMAFQKHLAQAS